jgi:hypothetical protein
MDPIIVGRLRTAPTEASAPASEVSASTTDAVAAHPELGFYTLAAAPESPRELLDEEWLAPPGGRGLW